MLYEPTLLLNRSRDVDDACRFSRNASLSKVGVQLWILLRANRSVPFKKEGSLAIGVPLWTANWAFIDPSMR
jgi:hypothetical protein